MMLTRRMTKFIIPLTFICALFFSLGITKFRENIGRIIIFKLIDAEGLSTIEREWGTNLAKLMFRSDNSTFTAQELFEQADSCDWQNLILMAFESLRRNEDSKAEYWLNLASSRIETTSEIHSSFPPWFLTLQPNGDATIPWSPRFWNIRRDSDDGIVQYDQEKDVLRLSYSSKPNLDKRLIYSFTGSIVPDRWDALELEANVSSNTFLTFALHTKQGLERKIVRQKGTEKWEKYLVPLTDSDIRFIYLSIRGLADESIVTVHSAEFRPLKLISNSDSNSCFADEL